MSAPSLTFTRRQVRRYARKNGYTYAEAQVYFAENVVADYVAYYKAEFARLSAFDTTEFQEFVDSATCNAYDTLEEEGLERSDELPRFWEMAVATLSCNLDAAGISTK